MKNPKKPARINHIMSFFSGILILINSAMMISEMDAMKYLRKPREKGVKKRNASLVKTKAEDQKIVVVRAYRWKLGLRFMVIGIVYREFLRGAREGCRLG
jgi:hypothetical protein